MRLMQTASLFEGATDAMVKAANVRVAKRIGIGGGLATVIVNGDVGRVRAAVEAGNRVAGQVGEFVGSHVIANPAEGVIEAFLGLTHSFAGKEEIAP